MGGPPITGFSIRITTGEPQAGDAPTLTATGQAVAINVPAGGLHWSGWALTASAPIPSADGVTVVLAGELYHRDALRVAIGPSADGVNDDAELLLACWLRYGAPGLRLLDGRFAAVVTEGDTVVAATDHAGTVPLYVRHGQDGLAIATEAKALRHGGPSEPLPGTESVPGNTGVRRVRAGTAVAVVPSSGKASAIRTWLPPEHRIVLPEEEAVRRVYTVLDEAVRSRLDGGPVTVVLSGGIDSSSVAALTRQSGVETISLGTDAGDEFEAARTVADHIGTRHSEFRVGSEDLVRQLPWAVAAAEIIDADVLEYLLPLVVMYRLLPGAGRRILTGYGADIPLGGMHRATRRLDSLDTVISDDMNTFDGLNEMSPVLGCLAGHWTTHPYWDRSVLDVLTALEPGLKRRHGRDKWVLREAMRDLLPEATVSRPKLGIHEGSGTTSVWTSMLLDAGVAAADVPRAKRAMAIAIHDRVVGQAEPPADVSFDDVLRDVIASPSLAVVK
ncbi:asparagine synthase-related protein [Kibdelosporangium philippinense]|uniref:Asparagine synthase-related protein n=1 Tax=Kibdelosporangium philippinense TaxID=211113 RepID=A0ABS8ZNV7_9PSEU|nr:asparagine synthase-related protein [Kibdelosporangium philippinense]MCE7008163.1 asparagine synthase-related protein [Kibdelosporangium philippinense]